jgi:hypothetical protein
VGATGGQSRAATADAARPRGGLVLLTVAVTFFSAVAGGAIFLIDKPDLHLNANGFAVFAPIYFAAQAIERFLEPLTSYWNPTTPLKNNLKKAREDKLATQQAAGLVVQGGSDTAAEAVGGTGASTGVQGVREKLGAADLAEKAALTALRKARSERKLLWFMVATAISCVLAGILGLGILQAIATPGAEIDTYLRCIDIGLTGIVIGAGTQPLHDLFTTIQKSKENADAATKPTGQLPGTPGTVAPPATPTAPQ